MTGTEKYKCFPTIISYHDKQLQTAGRKATTLKITSATEQLLVSPCTSEFCYDTQLLITTVVILWFLFYRIEINITVVRKYINGQNTNPVR
jgi:hypothetical protein